MSAPLLRSGQHPFDDVGFFDAGDPVGDVESGRVFAGQERGAGGGADRAGRITVGEADAILGELVDMRSLVEAAAVAGKVSLAHVIH